MQDIVASLSGALSCSGKKRPLPGDRNVEEMGGAPQGVRGLFCWVAAAPWGPVLSHRIDMELKEEGRGIVEIPCQPNRPRHLSAAVFCINPSSFWLPR